MRKLDPQANEKPGWRSCQFCTWRLYVTEVDLCADTIATFNRHLQRHAEAATVEAFERATFDKLTSTIN